MEFRYWEERYQRENPKEMLWHLDALDHDVEIELRDAPRGSLLDVGCGAGTQAVQLAQLGFPVTATDIAPRAVELTRAHALEASVKIVSVVDDILSSELTETFDYIVDRGCFHVLPPEKRQLAIKTLQSLLRNHGRLLLKVFHRDEHVHQGPYRFGTEELEQLFSEGFRVRSIRESTFEGRFNPPAKTIFAVFERKD